MSKAKDEEIKDGYTNAFWNLLEPFRTGKAIQGSLQYVGIEVLVGQVVRRAMNMKYNWQESAEIHTYSLPLIGQLNFGEAFGALQVSSKAKVELMDEATDGAKAIPGAIGGFIAQRLRRDGFKVPAFGNKDFIALLVGKVVSRPLTAYLFSSLPNNAQVAHIVLNEIMNRQKAVIDAAKEEAKML
jgi:hypothetical protein